MEKRRLKADEIIDGRSLSAPWCLLKVRSELKLMKPNQILEISCVDSGFIEDLKRILSSTKDEIVDIKKEKEIIRIFVKRG